MASGELAHWHSHISLPDKVEGLLTMIVAMSLAVMLPAVGEGSFEITGLY
jgi:hypothetical protein